MITRLTGDMLVYLVSCGFLFHSAFCQPSSSRFTLSTNYHALVLLPGTYSTVYVKSRTECAIKAFQLNAPGYAIEEADSHEVNCYISFQSVLAALNNSVALLVYQSAALVQGKITLILFLLYCMNCERVCIYICRFQLLYISIY